jgi:pimeloyl-ACP methyl ester carboxylesterase
VGHSLGGLIVRKFAVEHPAEVAGMVLVDSAHEEYLRRAPASALEERARVMKTQRAAYEKDRADGVLRGSIALSEVGALALRDRASISRKSSSTRSGTLL